MATREEVLAVLRRIELPGGGDLVASDMVRALSLDEGRVRFVIEAPDAEAAGRMEPLRAVAERAVASLPGVESVSVILTAHGPAQQKPAPQQDAGQQSGGQEPPNLKIGRHPTPQQGPQRVAGVQRILAVASGKGGVGKSTVSTNLAVALAREGRKVGLLDADIYGPSIPRMMGVEGPVSAPDGKTIQPLHAHGVTVMSIGLMVDPDKAVVWRGPMLMGALQQMLGQVAWGELDVLIVDLPPGTGDVQLTLCQRTALTGAIVVSTPQDVALLDARKAIDMFATLKTPVLGMIENMSLFICPECGHEAHIFGHGGVRAEAEKIGAPLLGALPIDLETRLSGDEGVPVAAKEGPISEAWRRIARGLVSGGIA